MTGQIPAHIAILLVGYFAQTTTPEETQVIDDWICASEENMRLFEECLEATLKPVLYDPDRGEEFEPGLQVSPN